MTVQKRAPFTEDSVFFFLKIININFKTFLKVMSKHFHTLNWVCIVFLGMQLASLHLAPSVVRIRMTWDQAHPTTIFLEVLWSALFPRVLL